MKRMKVLMSAFACEPNRGSEPGAGWNIARAMAKHHDVWVLTRARYRQDIEAHLAGKQMVGLKFVYFDLPHWPEHWNYRNRKRTMEAYYYAWQIAAYPLVRRLHSEIGFDLTHHVTFARYWMPSVLALLPAPFIWGPVGGGESAPEAFCRELDWRSRLFETVRDVARWLGEHDPLVRLTARRCAIALATTQDTAARLNRLYVKNVRVLADLGLRIEEVEHFGSMRLPRTVATRFISIGRLLHWKGFDLGLRAFAAAKLKHGDYWIVGDGPERQRLERLARELGIANRVEFTGLLSRHEVLQRLGQSHILVHPSLHDSGGWVCMEAMAARRPVLCLDLGGPAVQVTPATGYRIPPHSPEQAVQGLANAMSELADDHNKLAQMGEAAHLRVREVFVWSSTAKALAEIYSTVVRTPTTTDDSSAYVTDAHPYVISN